ncbi:MAG TPA: hypothetical protein VIZ19_12865 [Roseiarcus sp.]
MASPHDLTSARRWKGTAKRFNPGGVVFRMARTWVTGSYGVAILKAKEQTRRRNRLRFGQRSDNLPH